MIILFSSGEYSDYGLSGLLEVDADAYHKAKTEFDELGEQQKEIREKRYKLSKSGDITRNQADEMYKQMQKIAKQRHDVWAALKATGTPVEYTEFWDGDAY